MNYFGADGERDPKDGVMKVRTKIMLIVVVHMDPIRVTIFMFFLCALTTYILFLCSLTTYILFLCSLRVNHVFSNNKTGGECPLT